MTGGREHLWKEIFKKIDKKSTPNRPKWYQKPPKMELEWSKSTPWVLLGDPSRPNGLRIRESERTVSSRNASCVPFSGPF